MKTPVWVILVLFSAAMALEGVEPVPGEYVARDGWFNRVFGETGPTDRAPFMKVLEEDSGDSISRGKSWRGTAFQLGEKTYSHGVAFNSTKRLLIHVGRPAKRFVADIGLENNDDTRRGEQAGQGSVSFHVLVGGREIFTSKVLRRKDGPLSLSLPLSGATEFEIQVKDGGDGRGWDQALWGEATLLLEDGTKLRLQDVLMEPGEQPFAVSFLCDGKKSSALLQAWKRRVEIQGPKSSAKPFMAAAKAHNGAVIYADPHSGLEVRIETVAFHAFPAVEWVAHITNKASTNSPLLESIQAFDGVLPVTTSGSAVLHWSKGAVASFEDFAPQETVMKPGSRLRLQAGGGRSSSQVMPFFNLEGNSGGVVAAIGWTGEWAAEFNTDSRNQAAMRTGLDRTHLVLRAGESIRTPRMLLLFYEGDRWRGQNLLRQFILAHHRPLRLGKPLVAPVTCGNWGGTPAAVHLDNIKKIIRQNLPIDYYWIDAEWYGQGGWPVNVGNWQVKKDLYPHGFKPLSEELRKTGRELMLWFEPERVFKGTAWHKEHANWLLDGGDNSLLNLGNPDARKFLTDFISSKIDEFGLGCYRQDFNIDPLPLWRAADAPDRQGITEIRYIEGLYAFWDELLERHAGLIIDNCASGGRRLDLETIGRATPFWRTDGPRDAIAHQCHTYGLMPWVPLSATSQDRPRDDYEFRSSMCSALCLNWWVSGDAAAKEIPADFPFDWAEATLQQYLNLRELYYGDYYPLTGYSQAPDVWMAYQLDRPDLKKGVVVALRRRGSPYEKARLPLHAIEEQASYKITETDTRQVLSLTGRDLMHGVEITLKEKPGSVLLFYERSSK